MPFAVVSFVDEKGMVDYVPKGWLLGKNRCKWPPYELGSSQLKRAMEQEESPGRGWSLHKVRILGEAGQLESLNY